MIRGLPMGTFQRTIFHVDMDAFFVSVEELFNPELKGKAVVVGGQRDERGVVSAASYEARKFGVHSAMPLRTAAKLCPHAIFVNGHPDRYRECSEKVHRVLSSFSPQVEMGEAGQMRRLRQQAHGTIGELAVIDSQRSQLREMRRSRQGHQAVVAQGRRLRHYGE